jgi:DNA-binding MarR family transcriptional regulator
VERQRRHPPTPVLDLAQNVGFLVRKLYQKNQTLWQTTCPDPQLTSVQFAVLNAIFRMGPSSLAEIGRAAAMDSATTRGVVDRLHARDLVALESSSQDRRKVIVTLTPAGGAVVQTMQTTVQSIADATLRPLNPAERIALQFLLLKATEGTEPAG